jgi:PKHD-type hydroxylase
VKTEKVISMSRKLKIDSSAESTFISTATSWPFELDPVNTYAYWDDAFTENECDFLIALGNAQRKLQATVGTKSGGVETNNKIRESEVSWLYPNQDTAWAFKRLTDIIVNLNDRYFKFDIFGAAEGFQFTKYVAPTGHYGKHIDCGLNTPVRKLSFTLQLSDEKDYEGGDLILHTSDNLASMKRSRGSISVFPSYVMHEVTPVTKGTRYSLVSWITGKPFK